MLERARELISCSFKMYNFKEVNINVNFKEEIFKSIQSMVDKKINNYKSDRTFKSVIIEIDRKGYVILDETGNKRTVKCAIPNAELKVGKHVWVKVPCSDLKGMHICGVV